MKRALNGGEIGILLLLTGVLGLGQSMGAKLDDGYGETGLCEACLIVGRVSSDFLCDFAFIDWAISSVGEAACTSLPKDEKDQCLQLVDVLLPLAIEYARTTATPESMCSYAGLCKPDMAVAPSKAKQLLHQLHEDSAQCAQCRYVVRTVKANSQLSQEHVADVANTACLALPEDLVASCSSMVYAKGRLLASLIRFDHTCELLGACAWSFLDQQFGGAGGTSAAMAPLGALAHTIRQARAAVAPFPVLQDASTCDKCKLTVLEVRMVVNSAAVQHSLLNVSRALCDHVAPYEEECRAMVDKYAPAAFSLIDKYLQPDTVCGSLLHLCPVKEQLQASLAPAKRHGYPYIQPVLDTLQRMWQGRPRMLTY